MLELEDPEDRKIRIILISAAAGGILLVLLVALVVTIMISMNFNFLEWME